MRELPLTDRSNEDVFADNTIDNLRRGKIKSTRDIRLNGAKVLIVGACPSLDDCHQDIRDARAAGWLIWCADRAYVCLKMIGIKPDMVMTLDPSESNCGWFDDYDGDIIACIKCNPGAVTDAHNVRWYVPTVIKDMAWYKTISKLYDMAIYPEFGCVVNYMYLTALLHGAGEIDFMGHEGWYWGFEIEDNQMRDTLFVLTQYYARPIPGMGLMYKSNDVIFKNKSYSSKDEIEIHRYPVLYQDGQRGLVKKYTDGTLKYSVDERQYVHLFVKKATSCQEIKII